MKQSSKLFTKVVAQLCATFLRTFRVDIDWLFQRVREDLGIYMKYVNTKDQLADMLTKGSFTAAQWNHLCFLFSFGPACNLKGSSKDQEVGTQEA